MLDDAALDAERVSSEHQRRGIPFSLEENERRESTSGRIDERDGGRDERTVGALEANARGREGIGVFALREKDENFTRDYGCISRDFDERGSVSRRETRSRGERVGVRVSDFEFCGKGEGASERRERRRQRGGDDDV